MTKRSWTKEEIKNYRKAQGSFFYCNKDDSNFLVPKAYGIGWTLNWANPISWTLGLVIIGIIVFSVFFK